MSSYKFPLSLPGIDIAISRRGPIYATQIQTTSSGKEQRASWQAVPRYEYDLKINVLREGVPAPAPFQALDEVTAVLGFGDDHRGAWDSFLIDDPLDGTERRVRFVEDSFTVVKIAEDLWETSFSLVTVK